MPRTPIYAAILLLVSYGVAHAEEKFANIAVHFEQNATDEDVEVVFKAKSGDAGLSTLKVVAPDGRTVVDFNAPDSKLGLRHIDLESPEPKNVASVKADFPEGEYTFTGRTVTGDKLRGKASLSHKLPDTAVFVRPRPDEKAVPVKGLRIKWNSAKNPAVWVVVIEREGTEFEISAKLPSTARTFVVPDGFLLPDTEYKLEIGAVSGDGNTSVVETSFTTKGKK